MTGSDQGSRRAWLAAFVAAVLLQLPLMGALYWQTRPGEKSPEIERPKGMKARFVPQRRPKPPEPEPPPEEEGVVVELPDPPKPEKPPEDTKYLAKEDQTTPKETKARERTKSTSKQRGKVKAEEPSPIQSPDSDSPRPTELPEQPKVAELPRPRDKMPESDSGQFAPELKSPTGSSPLLMPSTSRANAMANLQAMTGISASDDALLEVEEEADETSLDAKKFRYWDFFNRVKARVRDEWSPNQVYRRNDPTGRVHGVKDRLTLLKVTLDAKGNLVQMSTTKPSGLDFLDREARRAMRAAAPFANPPAGLADERGLIEFQFGFMFEISRGRPKFFWKRM